jgi:hypothetical protein
VSLDVEMTDITALNGSHAVAPQGTNRAWGLEDLNSDQSKTHEIEAM